MNYFYGFLPGVLIAFGMGGGTLLIYILNIFEKFSQQQIQYINLWSYVFCSFITILMYQKKKHIDFKVMKFFLPLAAISCIISSCISRNMDTNILKRIFGYFLIVLGIWQLLQIIYEYIKNKKANDI